MRVSNAYRYDQLSSQIGAAELRVQQAQDRATTGKRINKASDDPTGTRQLLGIGSLKAGIAGYTKNLDTAKGALGASEAAYGDIGDLIQQAQALAVQGATTTIDQTTRNSIAEQVQTLRDRLVALGNSQGPDGRFLFGGQVTDAKPFSTAADGSLVYAGNTTVPSVQTGPGETTKVGETGTAIGDLFDKLTSLKNDLASGNVAAVSGRLDEIKAAGETMVSARADVGRRLNSLETSRASMERRDLDLTERATEVGEIDYAAAIVEFTAAQSAYQAALQVASKGFSMGLMDFIR
ncbi:flagellar hook-associated protein 3 [bacterium]|nr:MAG: flagellar hook-associated protein 3 [bacterium]